MIFFFENVKRKKLRSLFNPTSNISIQIISQLVLKFLIKCAITTEKLKNIKDTGQKPYRHKVGHDHISIQ